MLPPICAVLQVLLGNQPTELYHPKSIGGRLSKALGFRKSFFVGLRTDRVKRQKLSTKAFIFGTAIFVLSGTAAAYWFTAQEKPTGELAGVFCPDMANEQAYKDKKVQTYATLIPGKDGWIFRTKNDFRSDWAISNDVTQHILGLQEAMRTHNAELVIIMPPVRGMIHVSEMLEKDKKTYGLDNPEASWNAYESFINDAKNAGINIVGINRDEVNDKFFYKRNHHWSAEGARVAAQKVAENIKNLSEYTDIPKIKYVSKPLEPKNYKSSYDGAFQKICGTKVPPEMAQNYETTPADNAASQQALFDDKAEPQVVLLGTSNSVPDSSQANFEGFLKEYLSADVMNMAVAGAGIDTSIISYMNSAHYKDSKPKIVVWEIPGYYKLGTLSDVFSQAISAAYGSCNDKALAKSDFKNIVNNSPLYASEEGGTYGPFPTGEDPRQANLDQNNNLYLHLAFAQPMKSEFAVKFHYKTGEQGYTKIVKFKRSNRYPADGEFYTLFPHADKGAELNKVRITLPEKIKSIDVAMQICALPQGDGAPSQADESL